METSAAKYCHYLRVSTQKQGIDGYGMDAQREAIAKYIPCVEFIEVESGKKKDRPELLKALAYCKKNGAVLVVAKLDRLARNVAFVSMLMESKVEFLCADFPTANRLTIHIIAAVAEHEATMISARTKAGLAVAKARGPRFCDKRNRKTLRLGATMNTEKAAKGRDTQKDIADRKAQDVSETVQALWNGGKKNGGKTLQAVADQLNNMGVKTPRGAQWTPTAIKNCLARI